MEKAERPEQKNRGYGVRIGVLNGVMIVIAFLVSSLLIYVTFRSVGAYNDMREATQRYIACQQDAFSFQEGSDYLTNQARYFFMTGDSQYAKDFMEEVEVTRRRDRAVEEIYGFMEGESYAYLSQALDCSNALMEVEKYAMRLSARSYGLADGALPEGIGQVALKAEDAALAPEAQRDLAYELLFGEDYQSGKAKISQYVENSITALIGDSRARQVAASEKLKSELMLQRVMIIVLLAILATVVTLTYLMVIRPLRHSVKHIRSHQRIPVSGSDEMRFLARTYNEMFEQHTESTEKLTYSATHDSLTGVLNRTAYDSMLKEMADQDVCALIVDIDKFKSYNDTYGHDMGDRVLQKVARALRESFRSDDDVYRIGGDEFCVVMKHARSAMWDLVKDKIDRANRKLQNPEDGMPSISMSVGVAFADRESPQDDIFKDADTALYSVKRGSGGECALFGA